MEPTQKSNGGGILGIIGAIVAIGVAVAAFFSFKSEPVTETVIPTADDTTSTVDTSSSTTDSTDTSVKTDITVKGGSASSSTSVKTYTYTNGTYTASGTYRTPESNETLNVTLTLKNDIVTDVSLDTSRIRDRESKQYVAKFVSGYKQYVVGKNISTLSLGKVSGSSLTPIGFNNAVTSIKSQAKNS